MPASPLLVFHIAGGTVGILSGFLAAALRKGSRRHRIAGNLFFVSMLCMSSAGAYMAFMKSETSNVFGGLFTFYMVATGWMTARRRVEKPGLFDFAALLFIVSLAVAIFTQGVEAATSPTKIKDASAPMSFVFGSLALLAAAGDVRMVIRGGISGTQRLARHLWRMCFGLFAASASIFLARPHLFPALLRRTYVLALLGVLPLLLMIFWLIRVRLAKQYRRTPLPREAASKLSLTAATLSSPHTISSDP